LRVKKIRAIPIISITNVKTTILTMLLKTPERLVSLSISFRKSWFLNDRFPLKNKPKNVEKVIIPSPPS
jgi:hypothetical protein